MNMLFAQMIPDSEIARKFACGRTKTTAIVKEALSPYYHAEYNLDFSKAIAFMSDTTNVMKGARSGVQKLIKRENPSL